MVELNSPKLRRCTCYVKRNWPFFVVYFDSVINSTSPEFCFDFQDFEKPSPSKSRILFRVSSTLKQNSANSILLQSEFSTQSK